MATTSSINEPMSADDDIAGYYTKVSDLVNQVSSSNPVNVFAVSHSHVGKLSYTKTMHKTEMLSYV
jgi:hypothetical protein